MKKNCDLAVKPYLLCNCISFTIVVLLFSLSSFFNIAPQLSSKVILQLFSMTSLSVILMFFTDKLPIYKNRTFLILIDILDICISVFGLGILYGVIPVTADALLSAFLIILLSYFGVYGVLILRGKQEANLINHRIHEAKLTQRKEHIHEQNH